MMRWIPWMRTAAAATLAVLLVSCGGAAEEGQGTGEVLAIDAAAAQVTLRHGEIPGVMKAMTMAFDVSDPQLLSGLAVGDEVVFELRYAEGAYTVTAIEKR